MAVSGVGGQNVLSGNSGRLATVPNAVTFLRLACVPLFLYLLVGRESRVGAALLLAALGATDWIDGYLARRLDQVSDLGAVMDPLADRILLASAVVAMLSDGSLPAWLGVAMLLRETTVGGATIGLALAGARRIEVLFIGKAGTLGLMFALPLFLYRADGGDFADGATWFAWGFALPGLTLAYCAAFSYITPARTALEEGRASRTSASGAGGLPGVSA